MTYFFRSSPSLRRVLIIPYVCLVFVLAAGIGLLSYRAASRTVGAVTDRVLLETVGRIGQAVEQHIGGSRAVLEVAFPSELSGSSDLGAYLEALRKRLWVATSLYPDLDNYVYYGNRAGQDIAFLRLSEHDGQFRIKLNAAEHRRYYNVQGLSDELKPRMIEDSLFDPRLRLWYQMAQAKNGDIWTPVYIDFGTHDLVVTRARKVLSPDGQFEGVVATDVSLRALNDYAVQLRPSKHGLVFVMEADGSLIASSVKDNLGTGVNGKMQRQNAATDPDAILKATYAALIKHRVAGGTTTSSGTTFTFSGPDGRTMYAAYGWITDSAGLKWIAVVAIPSSDFMGDLIDNAALTGLVGIFAVTISIFLGLFIVNWVVKDIGHLSDVTGKIGKGDLQAHIVMNRRDEIGKLATSIELMQLNLSTDKLTGLTSRAALMHYLTSGIERLRNIAEGRAGFAVLFIDLNRFKPINDQYGHQLGDQTLIEIAGRLRKSIRQGDVAARYGGDEFVIVLWQIKNREGVKSIIGNLHELLSQPLHCLEGLEMGRHIHVGASIGVALYPGDGADAETLIKKADQRMYEEKQAGVDQ